MLKLDDKTISKMIVEVKKRPILYDEKFPDFSVKRCSYNAWENVCEEIYNDWDLIDKNKRQIIGKFYFVLTYKYC